MALKESLLKGFVAFVVATLIVRKVGNERLATRIGLLTGGSVAVNAWLSAEGADADVELDDVAVAE